MLALKKKREAEAAAKKLEEEQQSSVGEAGGGETEEEGGNSSVTNGGGGKGKVSLLGIGGQKKTKSATDGASNTAKKRTPGEIRIQKGA